MQLRKTKEQFIEQAKLVHCNDKYDYSKIEYINNSTKLCILCQVHGEFWQNPYSHLCGCGCPKCANEIIGFSKRKTREQFIEEALKLYNEKYNYDKVIYINARTKINILCPEHGEFWQAPETHLRNVGCAKCGIEKRASKLRTPISTILKQFKDVHGDTYCYSKINDTYLNSKKHITIICKIHGEFTQAPISHLAGNGCSKCGHEKIASKLRGTTIQFIEKAKKLHGNLYDYSKVNYIDNRQKICILCREHGEFWQSPSGHLQGGGCSKCNHGISYTEDEIKTCAKKYTTRSEFFKNATSYYNQARRKKILDDVCIHMKPCGDNRYNARMYMK